MPLPSAQSVSPQRRSVAQSSLPSSSPSTSRKASFSFSPSPAFTSPSQSYSRPQSPVIMRRPASSLALRSPTPTQFGRGRPATPSFHGQLLHANNSSPALSGLPTNFSTSSNVYTGSIRVAVRVKPGTSQSLSSPSSIISSDNGSTTVLNDQWTIDSSRNAISSRDVGEFVFDSVYHGPISNENIFDGSVRDLVNQVMAGFNGTVFAYGMTGSGKTYSMQGSSANPGIIPLSAACIFDYITTAAEPSSTTPGQRSFTVKVSYLEIYNEHLHDLLNPGTAPEDIKLRDDPVRGGVRAMGLKEVIVSSPEELLECIRSGDALRRTEGTEYNSKSSRSHAVVQIFIESASSTGPTRSSLLYLCDLAGSERAAAQTERRKEGAYINKSLLTLGTVISRLSAVSSSAASTGHIPYRDSKLTRLLQPALSGKSLVSILCTIDVAGPLSSTTYVETISTLRFAARAKNIAISVKRNDEVSSIAEAAKIIERLTSQVEAQKLEIARLKIGRGSSGETPGSLVKSDSSSNLIADDDTITTNHYTAQIAQLEAENRILHERVEHLTRLCDDTKLEEMILLGGDLKEEGTGSSTSSPKIDGMDEDDLDGGGPLRRQIDEYRSYIAHLEKQLYEAELSKALGAASLASSSSSSTSSSTTQYIAMYPSSPPAPIASAQGPVSKPPSTAPPISPSSSVSFDVSNTTLTASPSVSSISLSAGVSTSTTAHSSNHYTELISELRDEIEELRESNADKERIIATMRSFNKRKENINALSASIYGTTLNISDKSGFSSGPSSPIVSTHAAATAATTASGTVGGSSTSQMYSSRYYGQAITSSNVLENSGETGKPSNGEAGADAFVTPKRGVTDIRV